IPLPWLYSGTAGTQCRSGTVALVREAANVVKGFPGHSLPIGGCATSPGHAIWWAKKHTKKLKKIEMGHTHTIVFSR
ncbi:MAG: hypothetical protein VX612_02220, partial [Pseudomonadota bacterium]|nr:hypothetical protein [Pseudomonadota bacterium]